MQRGFWDRDCAKFTKKLWKPPLVPSFSSPYWDCFHNDIKLHYSDTTEPVHNINLLPICFPDNTPDKHKCFNKLFGKEIGRLDKFISDNDIKLPLLVNYISNIQNNLIRIRSVRSKKNIKSAFKFSNKTFLKFKLDFQSAKNISDANTITINTHLRVFDSILSKVDDLDKVIRCRQIKLFPTESQSDILSGWFFNATELYNELINFFDIRYDGCLEECNLLYANDPDHGRQLALLLEQDSDYFPIDRSKLRNIFNVQLSKKYSLPNCVSADIIMAFVSNVKGNITNLKSGKIQSFKMQKRSHDEHYSLSIQRKFTNSNGFYPRTFGKMETDESDKFSWANIEHDYKLLYDKKRKCYCINVPIFKNTKTIANRKPLAVMDPGSAIFQQLYGLDHIVSIAPGLHKPLMKHFNKIEYLTKRVTNAAFNRQEKEKSNEKKRIKIEKKKKFEEYRKEQYKREKKKYKRIYTIPEEIVLNEFSPKKNLKRAIERERKVIKGLVTELHNKTCIYLCKNYDRIMVTNFSCRKVNGKNGNLYKDVKKVLGALSHYKFRQRLQNKCAEYRCQYLEVTEEYTSKTCCKCGNIKDDLGGDRVYDCSKCKEKINRDTNGAINILIKNRATVIEE